MRRTAVERDTASQELFLERDLHSHGTAHSFSRARWLAERIQLLGGLSIAMAPDVAETTRIERPPRGRETVPVQISRLLRAHEQILTYAHEAASRADKAGDDGSNDLLVSDVIRTNELQ